MNTNPSPSHSPLSLGLGRHVVTEVDDLVIGTSSFIRIAQIKCFLVEDCVSVHVVIHIKFVKVIYKSKFI